MNTEPPEGDELQRMLVAMKQTVLERATPRPKRRRGRSGVVVGVVALLALGTATGAVALTLSQQDSPVAAPVQTHEPAPAPSATTPTSAPITATPVPRSQPSIERVATVPADCRAVVPASDYRRFFGSLQPTVMPRDDPETEGISCEWRQPDGPDANALSVHVRKATVAEQQDAIATFGDEGQIANACTEQDDGTLCQFRVPRAEGGEKGYTLFVRGDTSVIIDQLSFPTNGLLPAIVGEIWGD